MVLEPEHEIDTATLGAKRPFVGRDDCKALFAEALRKKIADVKADRDKAEPTVLVFYGVAGIGKTELQNRLAENVEDVRLYTMHAAVNFANPTYRRMDTALVHLRGTLKEKYQVSFDVFDLAYAVYWKKTHPQIPLNRDSFGLWDETGLLADLIKLAGDVPVIGLIPKTIKVLSKRKQAFQNWFTERAVPLLQKLPQMEPYQIADWLPAFLALDIKKHMQDEKRDLVVFLDTFEALWETERDDTDRLVKDNWVREMVRQLPRALWVITGREKLPWADRGPEWESHIDQHEIESLEKPDAMKYLSGCGIENDAIREVIFEGSRGVPYYLFLSVNTYEDITTQQERIPVPGDFGGSFKEIHESFLRNMNQYERDTLEVLSGPRWWDKDLFKILIAEFGTGFPLAGFERFHSFSFIQVGPSPATWSMHDLMRDHLREYQDKAYRARLHAFLFVYFYKRRKLEDGRAQ